MDADEHMDDDDDGSEYGSEYDASEYSDDGDDDASWKIRRGAARVLRAVSAKAPFALEKSASDSETNDDENKSDTTGGGGLFVALVRKLIVRGSRERDESCRLEVFAALEAALRAASPERGASASLAAAAASVAPDVARSAARWCSDVMTAKDKARGVKPTFKTRTAAFGVLHELATCVPGAFASDTFGVVAEACAEALESTSGAHIAAAGAGSALDAGAPRGSPSRAAASRSREPPRVLRRATRRQKRRCAPGRWRPLAAATRDAYYKTAAEALMACEAPCPRSRRRSGPRTLPSKTALSRGGDSPVAAAAEGVGAADRDAEVKAAATRRGRGARASASSGSRTRFNPSRVWLTGWSNERRASAPRTPRLSASPSQRAPSRHRAARRGRLTPSSQSTAPRGTPRWRRSVCSSSVVPTHPNIGALVADIVTTAPPRGGRRAGGGGDGAVPGLGGASPRGVAPRVGASGAVGRLPAALAIVKGARVGALRRKPGTRAAANARVPGKASATRRVRFGTRSARSSPLSARRSPRGSRSAATRRSRRFSSRRRKRRRQRRRSSTVRAFRASTQAPSPWPSARRRRARPPGGAPSPSARRRWCASSSPRRHKTRQTRRK